MYHFDIESKVQEAEKHRVELVEPRVDAPVTLKSWKQLLENAVAEPAAEPGVDCEPIAEPLRQSALFAAAFRKGQNRVDEDDDGGV